jgi:iduronate 2-sulfatase
MQKFVNVTDDEMGEGQLAAHGVGLLKLVQARRNASNDAAPPFFVAVGFHRPHIPWQAPSRYFDLYDLHSTDLPPHPHLPVDVPDIALNNVYTKNYTAGARCSCTDRFNNTAACCGAIIQQRNIYHLENYTAYGYWDKFGDMHVINRTDFCGHDNTTIAAFEQRRIRQAYRAAISFTDRNIGVLLAGLNSSGFGDSTIIVLWSDHGYQLGDNSQWAKHTNFEHATRIPFMMHLPPKLFPTFKPGRTTALLENIDLYPSLVQLATGATVSRCPLGDAASRQTAVCTEGLSFAPLLVPALAATSTTMVAPSQWKSAAFSQYARLEEAVMGYSVRVNRFRYTEWVTFNASSNAIKQSGPNWDHNVGVELYVHDDTVDATTHGLEKRCNWDMETKNWAHESTMAPTVRKLSVLLHKGWRAALPDASP